MEAMTARRTERLEFVIVARISFVTAAFVTCAPFGRAGNDAKVNADADSDADASVSSDAANANIDSSDGSLRSSGDAAADGGLGPGCFDFKLGSHGFTATGSTSRSDVTGFVIEVGGGKSGSVRGTLPQAPNKITKSVVSAVISVEESGPWTQPGYIDLFAQYFGSATSYVTAPAMELELTEAALEVNVWHMANVYDNNSSSYALSTPDLPTGAANMKLSTIWSTGTSDLAFGSYSRQVTAKATTATSDVLSIVFGGSGHGSTPMVTVRLSSVCVQLQ
jgi:hypothetical protein